MNKMDFFNMGYGFQALPDCQISAMFPWAPGLTPGYPVTPLGSMNPLGFGPTDPVSQWSFMTGAYTPPWNPSNAALFSGAVPVGASGASGASGAIGASGANVVPGTEATGSVPTSPSSDWEAESYGDVIRAASKPGSSERSGTTKKTDPQN
jgi:hypothetical protein